MAFKYLLIVFVSFYLAVSNINCDYEETIQTEPHIVKIGTVEVDKEVTMFYQKSGNGPENILILDGTLGDIRANNFDPILKNIDLINKYTVIQVDLPGFGRSRTEFADGTLSIKDYGDNFFEKDADAVIATLNKIGINSYSAWGWGYGGTVALFVAAKATDKVIKCIEWGAKPFSSADIVQQQLNSLKTPVSEWNSKTKDLQNRSHTDEYMTLISERLLSAWQSLLDSDNKMSKTNLKTIKAPTLLLHSDRDRRGPLDQTNEILQYATNAKLVVFKVEKHALHKLPEFLTTVEKFMDEDNYPEDKITVITPNVGLSKTQIVESAEK